MRYGERTAALRFLIPLGIAIFFLVLSAPTTRRAPWYVQIWWTIVAPPQKIAETVRSRIYDNWHSYVALVDAAEENKELKHKVSVLKEKLIKVEETKSENERLKKLLSYEPELKYPTVTARVISSDPRAEFQVITIDQGDASGLKPFMPVLGPNGLVGRVGEVGRHEARVLLVTDPNSSVDAFVLRSRQRTLVVGKSGKSELRPHYYLSRLEYLTNRSDVVENDVVVSSGLDGLFPAGIPIGSINKVEKSSAGIFIKASLVPFENMPELSEVMVVLKDVK